MDPNEQSGTRPGTRAMATGLGRKPQMQKDYGTEDWPTWSGSRRVAWVMLCVKTGEAQREQAGEGGWLVRMVLPARSWLMPGQGREPQGWGLGAVGSCRMEGDR